MAIKINYTQQEPGPLRRRGTKKKFWDPDANSWKEKTIWTVPADRELCDWLKAEYPNFAGWHYTWSDQKVTLEESIYLFCCLKFPHLWTTIMNCAFRMRLGKNGRIGAWPTVRLQTVGTCHIMYIICLCFAVTESGWKMPMVFTWSSPTTTDNGIKWTHTNLP